MKRCAFAIAMIVISWVLCAPAEARAGSIYVEGGESQLGTLDPTTGAITVIGQTSELLGGLGFDANGKLYGLGFNGDLYSVDTSTAALSLIGPYTGNFSGGFAFGNGSDGTLYATNGGGDLWSVNSSSGAATYIGNMGVSTNSNPSGGGGSNLYLTSGSNLYSVNPATASATLIGSGSYA
jgi:hypothetical protein